MTKVRDLHKKWSKDPKYKKAYKDLEDEFAVAQAIIEARTRVGLTQAQLAKRMKTTQSVIARLESGKGRPSTTTLQNLARATGSRLEIRLVPK
jgi:ribosome-binding protein aMBF1 (putative translation factor)